MRKTQEEQHKAVSKDRVFIAEYLETYLDELTPLEFYRQIFPIGELEEKGKQVSGKYNGVMVELPPKTADGEKVVYRYLINDDLKKIEECITRDNFVIASPISYIGQNRKTASARFIYALAFDLDGIETQEHLDNLFFQIDNEKLPKPTYIVWSGGGVHLYYNFVKPIPCFDNIKEQLGLLKKELTRKIWNKEVTTLYNNVQYQSPFQAFRVVGTMTKGGNRARAFEYGDKVEVEYLNEFVADRYRLTSFSYKSDLTLKEAKEKYPEWYDKRIIKKKKRLTWTTNRAVYDWWKYRVKYEATFGHRYFCIMMLAIYAVKCDIELEELEKDALELQRYLNGSRKENELPFDPDDAYQALQFYNDDYKTYTIDSIVERTNIPIEKNKRNFRKQKDHIEYMNTIREFKVKIGEAKMGRPKGSGTKEDLVKGWRKEHPKASVSDCANELGISRTTVYKYWENDTTI